MIRPAIRTRPLDLSSTEHRASPCEESGCLSWAKPGRTYCAEHVLSEAYPARVARGLEQQEQEHRLIRARGRLGSLYLPWHEAELRTLMDPGPIPLLEVAASLDLTLAQARALAMRLIERGEARLFGSVRRPWVALRRD